MINVSETIQSMFDAWFEEVIKHLGNVPDETKAFNLFWIKMSPEDAAEVLAYGDE